MIYALQSQFRYKINDGGPYYPWIFIGTAGEFAQERKRWIEYAKSSVAKGEDVPTIAKDRFGDYAKRKIQYFAGDHMFNLQVIGMTDGNEQEADILRRRFDPEWPRSNIFTEPHTGDEWKEFSEWDEAIEEASKDPTNWVEVRRDISEGNWFNYTLPPLVLFLQNECRDWDGFESEVMGIKGLGRPARKKIAEESRPPIVASTGLGSRLARRSTKAD